jgi:hypothetical protein
VPSDFLKYWPTRRGRRPKKWGFAYASSTLVRSGVLLYTAPTAVAVPRKFSSTTPRSQETSPPAEE